MSKSLKFILIVFCVFMIFSGCKKFLDKKPDKNLVIPTTPEDLQALLDNYNVMNRSDPSGGEISCDNYYLTTIDWNSQAEEFRRMYVWGEGDYFPDINNMWNSAWESVFIANTVLDLLPGIDGTNKNQMIKDDIKGQALFYRGKEFYQIATNWCLAYDSLTSKKDLGLPLRLTSDFNEVSVRLDNEATYHQIVEDLKNSIGFLPVSTISAYRPTKAAAYAILARVYLSMRKYKLAGIYSDSCLQLYNKLLDFNTLSKTAARPIAKLNDETIFYSEAGNWGPLSNSKAKIDSSLYNSFVDNDLRKVIFFKNNNNGTFGFKATYTGGTGQFTGPATDEVYLMRAECYARKGEVNLALSDLNTLLITRWETGTFIPYTASNQDEALSLILSERRKELLYRELRWMDIKRLNKENANITLKRIEDNSEYLLPPNDLRFALPIPRQVIEVSKMLQNPR